MPTARAARLFTFHSTKFRDTPPVLLSQLLFNLALLHVCVLSYPLAAAIGSVPEVPAESCNEVNTTEKGRDGKYWLSSIIPGTPVFAYCDMNTGG